MVKMMLEKYRSSGEVVCSRTVGYRTQHIRTQYKFKGEELIEGGGGCDGQHSRHLALLVKGVILGQIFLTR